MIDVGHQIAQANKLKEASNQLSQISAKCDQAIASARNAGNNSGATQIISALNNIKSQISSQISAINGVAGSIPGAARAIRQQEEREAYERYLANLRLQEELRQQQQNPNPRF